MDAPCARWLHTKASMDGGSARTRIAWLEKVVMNSTSFIVHHIGKIGNVQDEASDFHGLSSWSSCPHPASDNHR